MLRIAILCGAAITVAAGVFDRNARGAIRFELPELNVVATATGPSIGAFEVLVRADASDLPQSIGGFNIQLVASSMQLALGPPEEPAAPLLTSGTLLDFSVNAQNLRAAKDMFPAGAALYDGAALVRVPFAIPANVTGAFAIAFGNQNQLATQAGPALPISLTDTGLIRVRLASEYPASDFNLDGVVDAVDLSLWAGGFGTAAMAARSQGDANADADSDGDDFLAWQEQVGSVLENAAVLASVPEPESAVVLVAALTLIIYRRSARRDPRGSSSR